MAIELGTPGVSELDDAVRMLRDWQDDSAPMQLHPGDLGWFWRSGAAATAAAVRTWRRRGRILAVGLLDGPDVLRLTMAPDLYRDHSLAQQLIADVAEPRHRVLPTGEIAVEAPNGSLFQQLLDDLGWRAGEPWTPLRRDLDEPVAGPAMHVVEVGPEQARTYCAVHRASFGSPKLTERRWHVMASGSPYTDARSLLAYDEHGIAVAEATVWSAGPGRPGLLEPLGVHPDHRGRGYGTAISVAAAATLQRLGSSRAMVCTRSANSPAVATYRSAGYQSLAPRLDRTTIR